MSLSCCSDSFCCIMSVSSPALSNIVQTKRPWLDGALRHSEMYTGVTYRRKLNIISHKGLCNNYLQGEVGKWVKYAPKLSHAPPLINNIKANPLPPWKKSPPIDSLIPSLLVGLLPPDVCRRVIWRVIRITGLWACVVFAWIGRFLIFYNASLALRFPRAWVAWELDQSTQPCFHLS